jgi:hypothetical protein
MLTLGRDDPDPPAAAGQDDVELPARDDLRPLEDPAPREEAVPPVRQVTDPVVRDLPRVTCIPEGCERWHTPLPQGQVLDVGDVLVHVERKVGPPTDWPDEGREEPSRDYAILTAVDPAGGQIVWDLELRLPHLTDRRVQAIPTDDLVVFAWERQLVAVDARTGAERWTRHLDPGVHLVHPGPHHDVLVWWPHVHSDGEVARMTDLGGGAVATVPGVLASLDLGDGALRWQTEARPVLVTDTHLVSAATDGGVLIGIDLRDGSHAWSRDLPTQTERQPIPLADGRALVRTDRRLEVLDLATGATLADHEANTLLPVTAVGTTAVVHSLELRPSADRGRNAPTSVSVHPLDEPGDAAMRVDGVIAVHPLWDPTNSSTGSWRRIPAEGAAVVVQPGTDVGIILLGPAGEVRLDEHAGLVSERCCWRLHAGSDARGLVLFDPDVVGDRVVTLSTDDLAQRATVDLPRGMVATEVVQADPPVLIAHGGEGVGRGMWLATPDGLAGMLGRTELVRVAPHPVVMTVDGLIGLDLS